MTPGFLSCRISHITQWAPGLRSMRLDHVSSRFVAGQFFQLALSEDGMTNKRSYSAASKPGEPLEFLMSEVPAGVLTPAIFRLREGDELDLDPTPLGYFTLDEVPDCRVLWLISTGTGLGPTLSMLRQGSIFKRFAQICVVHGVRETEQLAYANELRELGRTCGLAYLPVVSRDAPPFGGLAGRVTQAYESGALERSASLAIDADAHVLLCGNPEMIEDMTVLLKARGLKKHRRREPGHFNYEKYW